MKLTAWPQNSSSIFLWEIRTERDFLLTQSSGPMGVFLEKKTDESWHVPALALNSRYAYVVHLEASHTSDYLVLFFWSRV